MFFSLLNDKHRDRQAGSHITLVSDVCVWGGGVVKLFVLFKDARQGWGVENSGTTFAVCYLVFGTDS